MESRDRSEAHEAAHRDHLNGAKLEHLGQTLASLPNLRAELARMQITTDAQGAFVHRVAWKMEHPGPDTMLAVLESKAAEALLGKAGKAATTRNWGTVQKLLALVDKTAT